jgi:hypothetical protein
MFSEIAGGGAALVSILLADQYARDLAGWGVDGTRVLEKTHDERFSIYFELKP